MSALQLFEFICGAIAIYVGARYMLTKTIPIVSEGDTKPMYTIVGYDAFWVGVLVVCFGIWLIAAALGLVFAPWIT